MITEESLVIFCLVVTGVTWVLFQHAVQLLVLYPVLYVGRVCGVCVPEEGERGWGDWVGVGVKSGGCGGGIQEWHESQLKLKN